MAFAQLIPGLPNDLAIQCLLCLSSKELLSAQEVCSLWKIAITSDRFYVERRLRAPYPSICAISRISSGYQILDLDVAHPTNPRLLFSCDAQAGQMLFPPGVVFASVGTSILVFAPGVQAQKFNLITRRWIPVSKTMPPQCKLLATTLGKHVVVLACKPRDDDDDDDDHARRGHGHGHGNGQWAMSEVFDSESNQWASLEGLPDDFVGTLCVTCEGILYVRGKVNDEQVFVYSLNLSKRKWEDDVHMRDRMQFVLHESKVITKPDAILMASRHSNDTVQFQHQRAGAFDWLDVVKVNARPSCDYFLFEQGEQMFLVVSDAGVVWRSRTLFYYHGLTILHIPSDELLTVESIGGM